MNNLCNETCGMYASSCVPSLTVQQRVRLSHAAGRHLTLGSQLAEKAKLNRPTKITENW